MLTRPSLSFKKLNNFAIVHARSSILILASMKKGLGGTEDPKQL